MQTNITLAETLLACLNYQDTTDHVNFQVWVDDKSVQSDWEHIWHSDSQGRAGVWIHLQLWQVAL